MHCKKMVWGVSLLLAALLLTNEAHAAIPASAGDVVLGEWNSDFDKCKKYAEQNGVPMMAVWSKVGCHMCDIFDTILPLDEFVAWRKQKQIVMCYVKSPSWSSMTKELDWISGSLSAAPFVRIYWVKDGKTKVDQRFTGRKSYFPPGDVEGLIEKLDGILKDWSPKPSYAGGSFAEESATSRLEAEAGTKSVSFDVTRAPESKDIATNNVIKVVGKDGTPIEDIAIDWAEGETAKTVTVTIPEGAFTQDGDQITLYMDDNAGNLVSTNHITYVDKANAASNPKWVGEEFDFGEWTMDIDAAKAKVAAADGNAYTLVSMQGSLWCPDCANTDRNFLEAEDDGVNRFRSWAESKQIALVTVDIPNWNGPAVTNCASPCLLSRTPYETTLARAKEYPASGADAALTNKIMRSGLGYQTRKGITEEAAAAQLEKFHDLATKNTSEGGFHRPEDTNKNRTGVPIFVLLRKDGTVAARLTRMASVSPMAADRANFDNYIKRFEEMLAIADNDATEIENNYPGAEAIAFKANGGTANGEICNADFQDVFRLDGVGGNALQKITVSGTDSAEVKVSLVNPERLDARGKLDPYATATGKLSDGVDVEYTFTEPGDYYVMVEGLDIASDEFKLDSATANNFHAFSVTGNVVLVPQEEAATGLAPESSSTVVVRLEKNAFYRLQGVKTDDEATLAVLKPQTAEANCTFFTALADGDQDVALFYGMGAALTYQKWVPGEIGFAVASKTVKENVGSVQEIAISRTGGKSGTATGTISIDPSSEGIKDFYGADRYTLVGADENGKVKVKWAEGVTSNLFVKVEVRNDNDYDGNAKLVLKLEVESDNGDVIVTQGKDLFTLNITEDEKQEPGRGMFLGANPYFGKAKTVYAKESVGAEVLVKRIEARDGDVSAKLACSFAGAEISGEDYDAEARTISWSNRDDAAKTITVKGIPAGKTAKLTLSAVDTFKILAASNSVTVVSVADDAPEFAENSAALSLYRYVTTTNSFPLKDAPAGKVTLTKLSGTLPAGLKVAYDASAKALALSGAPTAKAGTYVVVYQVKDGTVAGLALELTITLADPTDSKTYPETANAAVLKARTFKDLPVIADNRLVGTLQVTIPTKGNMSAKFASAAGTISLSAKSWSEFDPDSKLLTAELASPKRDYTMVFQADDTGAFSLRLNDGEKNMFVDSDGNLWSKQNAATNWAGYYTVALVPAAVQEEVAGIAPRGFGYLTLKMDSATAWNAGKMTWAGMLPNGTAVSGSTLLFRTQRNDDNGGTLAVLPVFKKSTTDLLAVVAGISENAVATENRRCVNSVPAINNVWEHHEKVVEAKADYTVKFDVCGGYFAKTDNIAGCCEEYYKTSVPKLGFDVDGLGGWISLDKQPGAVKPVDVTVGEKSMTLPTPAPVGMKLTLASSTGIVTGSVRIPYDDESGKYITATWKGVVIVGWGEGCGCGNYDMFLPFVCGSYYFSDKVSYKIEKSGNTSTKTQTVKRGGSAVVDAIVGE